MFRALAPWHDARAHTDRFNLGERLVDRDEIIESFPTLGPSQVELALHTYRLLWAGAPVRRERLAASLNIATRDVVRELDEWPSSIVYDEWRCIVGFGGLTIAETAHQFGVDGGVLFTWCAWDTLFIPGLLGHAAEVVSTCPETQAPVSLTVSPSNVSDVTPRETVVSFRIPERADRRIDIRSKFCRYVHFLSSPEAGREWAARHTGVFVLSLEEAFDLAQAANAALLAGC